MSTIPPTRTLDTTHSLSRPGPQRGRLPPHQPGALIAGRYKVVRTIGHGGFGSVYEVLDSDLQVRQACKEMDLLVDPSHPDQDRTHLVEDFRREAVALNQLHHPNIPPANYLTEEFNQLVCMECGSVFQNQVSCPRCHGRPSFVEKRYYLMMRYVDGKTLAESYQARGRPRQWLEVRAWFVHVASAIAELHRCKMTHGDIKPENVLIEESTERAYVIDLGLVRAVPIAPTSKATQLLSERTQAVGTLGYAAPEVFRNQTRPASDIYALGMLLFWALTDQEPTEDFLQMGQKTPREFNPAIPAGVSDAIVRATRVAAADRYSTVEDFVADLDRLGADPAPAGEVIPAPALPPAVIPPTQELVSPTGPPPTVQPAPPARQQSPSETTLKIIGCGIFAVLMWGIDRYMDPKRQSFYAQSATVVQAAAQRGDPEAQFELGERYYDGHGGLGKDQGQAASWYRKAAEQGYRPGQTNLGFLYENGYGVHQDFAEAAQWYRKASDQGDPYSACSLGVFCEYGRGVPQDHALAARWYRKAAEQGYAQAQDNLAICYREGRGVPRDDTAAVSWARKAAVQGHANGQVDLGWAYAQGRGVAQNWETAVYWYRKAAESGNELAENNLATCYRDGTGVPKDGSQAAKWYRKAADRRSVSAMVNLGWIYQNGDGVPRDPEGGVKWYQKAADLGYAEGQRFLAGCYQDGRGVEKSKANAIKWYRMAAVQGDADSRNALRNLGVSEY